MASDTCLFCEGKLFEKDPYHTGYHNSCHIVLTNRGVKLCGRQRCGNFAVERGLCAAHLEELESKKKGKP